MTGMTSLVSLKHRLRNVGQKPLGEGQFVVPVGGGLWLRMTNILEWLENKCRPIRRLMIRGLVVFV